MTARKKFIKRQGISTNNRNKYDDNDREVIHDDEGNKKSGAGRIIRWIIYSVCIFLITIVIFRVISTGTPGELQNYIIKSESVEKAYSEFKDELLIYKISMRNTFAVGDAFYIDSVYYIEDAENLQLTLRFKTNRSDRFGELYPEFSDSSEFPFKLYLKVSYTNTNINAGSETDIESEEEKQEETDEETFDLTGANWKYDVFETGDEQAFGKVTDKYRYFVVSFDGVKIDYANTKVELYLFIDGLNNPGENDDFAKVAGKALAQMTVFDINTPKSKVQAKKFDLGAK